MSYSSKKEKRVGVRDVKKNNVWRMTWIISLYAVLITILYLTVIYKVKWEDRDLNDYLYFYNCGSTFCTTTNKVDNYYSNIRCDNDHNCPTIIDSQGSVVILRDKGKEYIFNYLEGMVIDDNYQKYTFASQNGYYIVADASNSYGVIDSQGDVVVSPKYALIKDFKDDLLVYQKDGLLGIRHANDENIKIEPSYSDIVLINNNIFAGKKDDNYEIYTVGAGNKYSNDIFNYLYPYNGIILIIRNGQFDILDYNLKSKLIMKFNTYYPYTTEAEQGTLNIKTEGNIMRFTIYTSDTEYTDYIFDIKNSKLYS